MQRTKKLNSFIILIFLCICSPAFSIGQFIVKYNPQPFSNVQTEFAFFIQEAVAEKLYFQGYYGTQFNTSYVLENALMYQILPMIDIGFAPTYQSSPNERQLTIKAIGVIRIW